jgi:hypothetical protein
VRVTAVKKMRKRRLYMDKSWIILLIGEIIGFAVYMKKKD